MHYVAKYDTCSPHQLTLCCDGWHVADAAGCWAKLDFCVPFSESLAKGCMNLVGYSCTLQYPCAARHSNNKPKNMELVALRGP